MDVFLTISVSAHMEFGKSLAVCQGELTVRPVPGDYLSSMPSLTGALSARIHEAAMLAHVATCSSPRTLPYPQSSCKVV